jgi:hypothetical protein
VKGPNESGALQVMVWSVAPTALDCIQVLEPFDTTIPLLEMTGETLQIYLNDELVGEIEG